MTPPEPKACTACARHILFDGMHLCTLGPDCFDLVEPIGEPRTIEGEWAGMDCDTARKMGQFCGPAGKLWEPKA